QIPLPTGVSTELRNCHHETERNEVNKVVSYFRRRRTAATELLGNRDEIQGSRSLHIVEVVIEMRSKRIDLVSSVRLVLHPQFASGFQRDTHFAIVQLQSACR